MWLDQQCLDGDEWWHCALHGWIPENNGGGRLGLDGADLVGMGCSQFDGGRGRLDGEDSMFFFAWIGRNVRLGWRHGFFGCIGSLAERGWGSIFCVEWAMLWDQGSGIIFSVYGHCGRIFVVVYGSHGTTTHVSSVFLCGG